MKRSINLNKVLEAVIGYRGLPFPGAYDKPETITYAPVYEVPGPLEQQTQSKKGSVLRKADALGGWYFMPVSFQNGDMELEAQNALLSVTCEKQIVKTPLAGMDGSVKELISIDDYKFKVAGAIVGDDWPEDGITALHELFRINQAVKLKCAMSDIFLDTDDKVVITKIEYPQMKGVEHVQIFTLECVSDKPFELILE